MKIKPVVTSKFSLMTAYLVASLISGAFSVWILTSDAMASHSDTQTANGFHENLIKKNELLKLNQENFRLNQMLTSLEKKLNEKEKAQLKAKVQLAKVQAQAVALAQPASAPQKIVADLSKKKKRKIIQISFDQ